LGSVALFLRLRWFFFFFFQRLSLFALQ
jgi:hypothetical protein